MLILEILISVIAISAIVCALGVYAFIFAARAPKYYDGPEPTPDEWRTINANLTNFLDEFPNSKIGAVFPDIRNSVELSHKYRHLEYLKNNNLIDENEYQRRLNEILELIDISKDILS